MFLVGLLLSYIHIITFLFFFLFRLPTMPSFLSSFSFPSSSQEVQLKSIRSVGFAESCPGMQNELLLAIQGEPLTSPHMACLGTILNRWRLLEDPKGSSDDVECCQVFLHDGEQRRKEKTVGKLDLAAIDGPNDEALGIYYLVVSGWRCS